MSAYKTINCSFKNQETLIECLKELGFTPVVYKEKTKLVGYMGDERNEIAEIIIPRLLISNLSNDVGFAYDEDKKEYVMICSEYDQNIGVADKIKQSYAVTAIKTALSKNKFSVKSEMKDKTIKITAGKII